MQLNRRQSAEGGGSSASRAINVFPTRHKARFGVAAADNSDHADLRTVTSTKPKSTFLISAAYSFPSSMQRITAAAPRARMNPMISAFPRLLQTRVLRLTTVLISTDR